MDVIEEVVENRLNVKKANLAIGSNCILRLSDVKNVSLKLNTVSVHPEAYVKMNAAYIFLKSYVENQVPIYGTNTQFGDQVHLLDNYIQSSDSSLYHDSINERQENLIKSHTCGMGNPVSNEIVKVAMLLRAHCLSQGYSGIHPDVVDAIVACINADIIPVVPKYGSIGASGDLLPLATIASAIIGENVDVHYQGKLMKAPLALSLAGLRPIKPKIRDGLAMINGTSFMTAIASISLYNLNRLFKQMLASIAMTLESLMVIHSAYHPKVHQLKRHLGQQKVNKFLMEFWQGSQLLSNLDELRNKKQNAFTKSVQDYYSIRSVAQGFGPFFENLEKANRWVENEMNSVNDNPIINVVDEEIHHAANFMGYYVTDACDILKMNIGQASTWLHALLANLVHPRKNCHLPANLITQPEIYNGFRPIQLLAAALAVQNRKLAQSQQSFNLPTEGDNQDVNSLGTHAALDFQEAVENLERLTAIMLLAATQGLELRGIQKASPSAQHIYHIIREHSATVGKCRVMQDELNSVVTLLREEKI